uniref:Uncharacterized protein LOC111137899 n=1 Tax=Crassostrea virginica TaxID=6565 RepID=A0A8B8EZ78_CRAVI|nr:uncharacterized protein LOC111137899 [Crassostrea virginica]
MDSLHFCFAGILVLFVQDVRSASHCTPLFDEYRNGDYLGLTKTVFKSIFIPTFDTEFPADGRLSRDEVVSGWKSGHCDFRDPADGLLIFLESDLDRDFFVTDVDLDQLFNKFDSDHSGHISMREFLNGWSTRYGRHTLHSVDMYLHH